MPIKGKAGGFELKAGGFELKKFVRQSMMHDVLIAHTVVWAIVHFDRPTMGEILYLSTDNSKLSSGTPFYLNRHLGLRSILPQVAWKPYCTTVESWWWWYDDKRKRKLPKRTRARYSDPLLAGQSWSRYPIGFKLRQVPFCLSRYHHRTDYAFSLT